MWTPRVGDIVEWTSLYGRPFKDKPLYSKAVEVRWVLAPKCSEYEGRIVWTRELERAEVPPCSE